jgi:hypothetical protein
MTARALIVSLSGSNAIIRHELLRVGIGRGNARRGDGLILLFHRGHGQVQFEQLREQVFLGVEAVGGEDGGVEGGVGVFQRMRAGEFERSIDGAEPAGG